MEAQVYDKVVVLQWAERMGKEYLAKAQAGNWHAVAMIYRSFMDKLNDLHFNDQIVLFLVFNRHAAMA